MVWSYMEEQNRPFNATMLFENLHKVVSKPMVTKILEAFEADGRVSAKLYGKQKIFWANQDNIDVGDAASLAAKDAELKELATRRDELQEQVKARSAQLRSVEAQPTDADARASVEELQERVAALRKRIDASRGGEVVDGATMRKTEQQCETYRHEWKKRKGMVRNIATDMEEHKSYKDLVRDLGLETDEDYGVSLDGSRASALKRQKTG
jgi:26S proteasome regulatory subunit, ATPase 3, interacting protein